MLLRHQRGILIGFTLLIYSLQGYTNVQAFDKTISEQEGRTVVIPCPVNRDKCGELHSLNWFKGDNRIAAMLLDDSNVTSVADGYEDRVSVEQNPFRLIIRNLQIADEDIYLCDTTYFIPIETCDNFNGHRVELQVLVPPSEVVILDGKGDRIENGSTVKDMQERQTLKATCIVKNTRPMPQIGWFRGNTRLGHGSASFDEKDGLFTGTYELSLVLSRDDLGHSIECRAESSAIKNSMKYEFNVDLQVRPISITINGVEHHTVQGSKVVLTCDVHGARPPVNLTWFNVTSTVSPEENDLTEIRTKAFEKEDGTYHTQSELIFNATRFENDKEFRCEAENYVLQINREKPFQSSMVLEVLYPPVVKVGPPELAVNTSDTVLLNCEYVANPASLTSVVWYRNGDVVDASDAAHYEGGNSENVALAIRSTNKEDIGNYTCELSNEIGKGISEQQIDLDVQYVPIVEVLMIPEGPVKESDESNVTLFCNILDANPATLTKVRWYANSTLLKELPDCQENKNKEEDLCNIDPSKLLLESIGRGFFYNYSCEGFNAAGWGPRSEDKELVVHYEPGPASLVNYPATAVKKKSVTLTCDVQDPGYPESNRYRWMRGGRGPLPDILTKAWTIEPVGLDSRTNYSCYAFNEGGKGIMATVNLEVHAPPFFIKNLQPYTGMLHTSRNANLTCRIECVPRCEISWLKDGVPIEKNDTRYFVKDKYMDASPATGDFESMLSVLHFNMSNWPNNKFDIEGDNANYTCVSTGNTQGPGIKSATYFSIEYAPDNTTVSEEVVYVQEETIPARVICKSRANPEPSYEWHFNNKAVIQGNALIINTPMMRNDTGRYTCVAFNKHGRSSAETFIDVQYKPRCEIERKEINDQDTLICTAYGNPEEADFSWSIKAENESVVWLGTGDSKTLKDKSFYELKEDYAIARTYRCVANNTAGAGTFCEIEVAEQLAWWQRWDKTTLIIVVSSILVLLLAVVIICCIIICICRRRRRQDKYRTDVSMSATHSVLSYQPNVPQLIPANTVLPDTLKVPIMPQILMPATFSAQAIKEHGGIAIIPTAPTVTPTPTPSQQQTPRMTPQQTPLPNIKHTPEETISDSVGNTHNTATPTLTPAPTQTDTPTTALTSSTVITNTTVTNTSTTPTLSIRHGTQAPKSPPRWPLRPGVMVHVSSDTKENLAVNRMTLKPNATLANLTASTLNDSSVSSSTLNNTASTINTQTSLLNVSRQSATLGRIGRQGRTAGNKADVSTAATKVEVAITTTTASNNNNNNTTTTTNSNTNEPIYATLPRRVAQNQVMISEISTDLQRELQNMENVTDSPRETIETQRLTTQKETEIRVDIAAAAAAAASQQDGNHIGAQREVTATTSAASTEEPVRHCRKSHLERVEEFFANIFFKRRSKSNTCRDSQRSHVGLLGGKFWKRAEQSTTTAASAATTQSPFATEHRLKGIRSSGSVTYKKCAKTSTSVTTNVNPTITSTVCTISTATNTNSNEHNNTTNNTNLTNTQHSSAAITQQLQQIPQPQTQTLQQQLQQHLQQTYPQYQQHQQQPLRPLPVSTILMEPFSNINHTVTSVDHNAGHPATTATITNNSGATSSSRINNMNTNTTLTTSATPPHIARKNVTPSTVSTSMSARCEPTNSANSSIRSMRKGILKAPTPPPRPPPPVRRPTAPQLRLVKRSASLVCPMAKNERVQMQEKSSSMADPLTEPGEYENLPFHGLQTAPNKFTTPTTPTNFNNNTNVVRSVPRPKRLNGNISQTGAAASPAAATYYDEQETETQQQQQQQYYQQQQHQYSTMPFNRQHSVSASLNGMPNGTSSTRTEGGVIVHNNSLAANTLQHNQNSPSAGAGAGTGAGVSATSTNPHQITYNLNNCFPKSYTEYYQNQQQQQQQQHHPFQQKFANSPSASGHPNQQMLNAIEHDFSTYAVVERPTHNNSSSSSASVSAAATGRATNPFLAVSNFKKFDTSGDEGAETGANYSTTSMKRQGKRKTFVDKLEDKRFYSLKFAGNKQKAGPPKNSPLNLNASLVEAGGTRLNDDTFNGGGSARGMGTGVLGSLLSTGNKCKRHHSFAGGSLGDIDSKGPVQRNDLHYYDPPAYENINDAVQVHASAALSDMELVDPSNPNGTATVILHPLPYNTHNGMGGGGSQGPKKKHHQRQHQPKEDLNLIEPERLSIYRSDSGISNSSYECVTPLPNTTGNRGTPPPGKAPRTPKTPKTPKGHKNQTLAHSAVTASFNSSHKKPAPRVPPPPLYMNVNDQQPTTIANLERPSSPNSNMATSAYESASSSQNDTTCNDPTSMSSTTSLYSTNKGLAAAGRCNRHQQPPEITTPEEYEQYQLGHHNHTHSTSSLSVASSVSASGNPVVGRAKCKKQQRSLGGVNINLMELNKRPLATNPFLATNPAATSTTACSKKFRRQTISDPYAHIKHINECNQWRQLQWQLQQQQYINANNWKTHNYCTKSTNASKAAPGTTTASPTDKSSTYFVAKSHQHQWQQQQQQHQQISLQQCDIGAKAANDIGQQHHHRQQPSNKFSSTNTRHQQQMLMFYDKIIDNTTISISTTSGNDTDVGRPPTMGIPPNSHDVGVAGNSIVRAVDRSHYDNKDDQSFKLPHMSLSCDVAKDDDDDDDNAGDQDNAGPLHQHPLHLPPTTTDTNVRLSNRPKLPMTIATPNQSHLVDSLGCVGRPVKLPLRKYHSFHFQPTQTVAGQHLGKLQQLRLKQQQHSSLQEDTHPEELYFPHTGAYTQRGPLVFQPYQVNEDVTFKPIQPSEESEDSLDLQREMLEQPIDKRREEGYAMDSGDFTNFSKLSTPSKNKLNQNNDELPEEPPALPTTLPPAKPAKNVSFYGDKEQLVLASEMSPINRNISQHLKTQTNLSSSPSPLKPILNKAASSFIKCPQELQTSALFSKKFKSPEFKENQEDNNRNYTTRVDSFKLFDSHKSPLNSKASADDDSSEVDKYNQDLNKNFDIFTISDKSIDYSPHSANTCHTMETSQDLQKNPEKSLQLQKSDNSAFVKPVVKSGMGSLNKSPQIKIDVGSSLIKVNLNENPTQLQSPQHLIKLQKTNKLSTAKGLMALSPQSSDRQAKLQHLGKIYKISSPESSEEDKDSLTPKKSITHNFQTSRVDKGFTPRQLTYVDEQLKESPKRSTALNPAASLEALEMLTKSQPHLWDTNQAGSRQNVHQLELFHTLQKSKREGKTGDNSNDDDDEDLGYSYCEDEYDDDDDNDNDNGTALAQQYSPNVTVIMAQNNMQENQVKFQLTQTHHEVQI